MEKRTLGILGLGNMGSTLLTSILKKNKTLFDRYFVYDPIKEKRENFLNLENVSVCKSLKEVILSSEYIILAVKPQVMREVLDELKEESLENKKIITIAAGLPLRFYREILGDVNLTRVMPNTPYLVGEGAAGISLDKRLKEEEIEVIRTIFESGGKVILCDEKYLDVVTGLSGSGPAYAFVMIEALADGAVMMGLNRKDAYKLAAQTLLGAAKMVLDTGKHPGELKDMVTSPGGTTISAIYSLEELGFRSAVMKAVRSATEKARELGKKM